MNCVSERNILSEFGAFKDRIGREAVIRCIRERTPGLRQKNTLSQAYAVGPEVIGPAGGVRHAPQWAAQTKEIAVSGWGTRLGAGTSK